MAERVYLCTRGDESNLIDIDADEIKVVFNGKSNWFRKSEILKVHVKSVREPSALVGSILLGVLGVLALSLNTPLGVLLIAAGGLSFAVGMEWQRRLEIFLNRNVYTLTFFYRGVRDIHCALAKHGYVKDEKAWWLLRQ